jgi:hypothetical protein
MSLRRWSASIIIRTITNRYAPPSIGCPHSGGRLFYFALTGNLTHGSTHQIQWDYFSCIPCTYHFCTRLYLDLAVRQLLKSTVSLGVNKGLSKERWRCVGIANITLIHCSSIWIHNVAVYDIMAISWGAQTIWLIVGSRVYKSIYNLLHTWPASQPNIYVRKANLGRDNNARIRSLRIEID